MNPSYFDRSHLGKFGTIARGGENLANLFFTWYGACFADGALSARMKSLTALATAHVVQCPYCIDAYSSDPLEKGADLEQMTEAVHVAAAVRGASTLSYGAQMVALAGTRTGMAAHPVPDAYFEAGTGRERLADFEPNLLGQFDGWDAATWEEGELTSAEKGIIGVAIAHVLQSPYEIERLSSLAIDAGATLEQLTEAVHVAAAIRGGAALVHAVQMLEHLDNRSGQ